ncbi:holo-ACP synthase [Alphaproteobacteria bacterium]|nr:holo-ACP synthase [Alphaproteobacteria bacterium]
MILGIGIDICDTGRVKKTLKRFNSRFEKRCFTELEIKKCRGVINKANCYAKRFAAKEATSKALGTGIKRGISWRQIEVENLKSGKPTINLYGNAKEKLESMLPKNTTSNILITITDEKEFAQAFVIIEAIKEEE